MSLLLDALKKAAADKEKAGKTADEETLEKNAQPAEPGDELPAIDEQVFEKVNQDVTEPIEENEAPNAGGAEEELNLELDEDFEMTAELPTVDTGDPATLPDEQEDSTEPVVEKTADKPVPEVENKKAERVGSFGATAKKEDKPLPVYNHDDARKILEVSQKRYRNNQRIVYYGMYVFAAVLFFVASYLYYTTEALDNSQRPVFKPVQKLAAVKQQPAQISNQGVVARNETPVEANTSKVVQPENVTPQKKNNATTKAALKKTQQITIFRQKKPDPLSVVLQQAYTAYQSKQYDEADKLYRQVLQRDSRQRDALLGRAAIAVVQNRYGDAKILYQQTLRLFPDESIAKSALVDLVQKEASVASESELKLLLRNHPDAAHVHFSLGLLYARQERLAKSQQAFFDAFTLEQKADYAYNLAVMLDKLKQPKVALAYYKKASELADSEIIHFDEKKLLERIEQLEGSHE